MLHFGTRKSDPLAQQASESEQDPNLNNLISGIGIKTMRPA